MAHFVTLIRYTQQGIAKIKESPARLDAAKKAAEKAGGRIHAWYLTMGHYDAVLISEFPNDEAGAKFTLSRWGARQHNHRNSEGFHRGRVPQHRWWPLLNTSPNWKRTRDVTA